MTAPAWGGAWTKPYGEHYVRAGADYYVPLSWAGTETGDVTPTSFVGHQYSIYGEIGVLPWHPVQVTVALPLTYNDFRFTVEGSSQPGQATSLRPGDARLGLQVALWTKKVQLSLATEVKVPMYARANIGAEYGERAALFPLAGDGQIDLTPFVQIGGGFDRYFAEGRVGYRFRTEAFIGPSPGTSYVDAIPLGAKLGGTFGPVVALVEVDGAVSVRSDAFSQSRVSVGATGLFTVWQGLALEARFAGEVWARNAPVGLGFGVGMSWRMPYPE